MSNVLLSVFALMISGLPESDEVRPEPRLAVSAVFQNESDIPVVPLVERPRWLAASTADTRIIRGQTPGTYQTPPMNAPGGYDPFQTGVDPVMPYLNENPSPIVSGINGPQPQRLGFTPFFDMTVILPSTAKSPGSGHLSVQEYDGALRHVSMLGPDWVFTNTAQGGVRLWDGPNTPSLPGSVYRAGWDFMLSSPQFGAWSLQADFNPSINSDFQESIGREAFNLDGNITAFYQVSRQLMLVLGVQYWDRVDNIIIPNAGVVWNPTDRLELRLLFPKSRASYFLGNFGNAAHWLYATGEYHVESYQIGVPGVSGREQVQMSDWRVALGLRSDHVWYDKYVEVGYVFGREVQYLRSQPDFNLGDGIMIRAGVRF
ncbi:hypothetical protein [Schlesneria paludicola]|uniref:hypothetical protein n=1 Tax=Schlesneria paludicola TaxID=360056 RepID=UPI00029A6557|nr:hypothetical protein [Schlesneria paludicola]